MFRDRKGLVHVCAGAYGANSLMACEADGTGGLDLNMRGMAEVFDALVTCFQCLVTS